MFQTKAVAKIKTLFMFRNVFFRHSYILRDNVKNLVETDKTQMTIKCVQGGRKTRFACLITKAKIQTKSEYLIFITLKSMSKLIFSFFSEASCTVREDPRKSHCCGRHKFIVKAILCNTEYFYTFESDVVQRLAQNALLSFSRQQ